MLVLSLMLPFTVHADEIDVMIKGIDDGVKTNRQQDYDEALMNAKLQAIERAGIDIHSITKVENFQIKFDMTESRAKAALLPGFKVMDIGYQSDGTYLVVLSGKVNTVSEGIASKELRYAKSLLEKDQAPKAKQIINKIIRYSKDEDAVAEAMYCQVLWKLSSNYINSFEKLKAYYPNSKYVKRLEPIMMQRETELAAKRGSVVARDGSLTAHSTGIVYDKNTGLEWYACPDTNTSWYAAMDWAKGLAVAGDGWRMPTIEEYKALYPKVVEAPSIKPVLMATDRFDAWSSISDGSGHADAFNFGSGTWGLLLKSLHNDGLRAFAVRSPR